MALELQVTVGEEDDHEAKRRKAYGKGCHDALRILGVSWDEYMNITKLHRAEQALSGIEAKVFECMPIEESWDRHAIMSEMKRRTGTNSDARVVDGCIADLLQRGLIKEPLPHQYKRARVHQVHQVVPEVVVVAAAIPERKPEPEKPVLKPATLKDPLEMLAVMAADIRKQAAHLNASADALEAAALSVAERLQGADAKLEHYRELVKLASSLREEEPC